MANKTEKPEKKKTVATLTHEEASRKNIGTGHDLPAIALLVDANAALSRFTSQMFSGITPIFETECHFWTHSLLGTGIANLALIKIRRFITRTLGEARIPEQIEALRTINDSSIMSEVLQDGPIWKTPWLQKLPDVARGPVFTDERYAFWLFAVGGIGARQECDFADTSPQ